MPNGWQLRTYKVTNKETAQKEAMENIDQYQAWVDLGDRQPFLNIRPRQPGDRFQPLGMENGTMKLSDFMINEKIPQRARECWPIVFLGDEIIWVPGHRLAHPFRLTEKTERVAFLQLLQQ